MTLEELLVAHVIDVPDFPTPGVLFKDISPLLGDAEAFRAAVDALVAQHRDLAADKVVGIEARGFLLAAPVAHQLGVGVVPVRKPGKLPRATYETSYALEYGTNVLAVHRDAFRPGDRVLLLDDVLATGGTAAAAVRLVQEAGAEVVGVSVLLEIGALPGRELLAAEHPGLPVQALLTV
ncbi:MAG: adenine phosphoribosyltransferase [Frankiales bacterium]|nr:adenine phosphoribosyltransferase [Frankiales bacterium]